MIKDKVLIIDDEAGIRSSLKGILEDENYAVKTADSGEQALQIIRREKFDIVFLDIWLPEMNGIEVLKEIKAVDENIQVVMITGHGSIETAIKATKLGAYDFLEKPLTLEKVVLTTKNALRQKNLEEENIQLREKFKMKHHLVGESSSIKKLRALIKTAAPTDGRILIYGENGTGKELIARLIHQQSQRKSQRFVQINCAAIPDDLIENELFGYIQREIPRGDINKKGKLMLATGGTMFLDEIGDLSLKIQAKLARVIEEEKFDLIGTNDSFPINIRFIAASNNNLKELISKGRFRRDLFFKLNIIPMFIPPLRERKEDIPLLIDNFLKSFSVEYGKKPKTMNKEAMKAFINYSWPGNVSELINVIERFVIMVKEEEIKPSHLTLLVEPREAQFGPELNKEQSLETAKEQFEREFLHKTLVKHNWDLSQAASELKIQKEHFHEKLKNLGISFLG